ncbi:hypothetical protein H6G00_01750 [Leptolyngbya sp. FACHB-541]|uniref:hypothetical protein n=1 Tax=Leptolyngbya sp. FACHB-541 TaxID=2692810 RepID=UPI001682F375|nr:hypothetical protein [Leptolyngbya sp. FACHB-541]MBD1995355.1 hypothetical protein [Leptolyngbya sp. FACHB-541]
MWLGSIPSDRIPFMGVLNPSLELKAIANKEHKFNLWLGSIPSDRIPFMGTKNRSQE